MSDTAPPRPPRPKSRSSSHLEVVEDRPIWSRLTTRAVVLLLVLAALVMSLAYPLRQYIAQRAEIGSLQHDVAARQDRVAALEGEQQRWSDPAFVEAQARQRLHYVYPGEKGLVLLSQDDVTKARQPVVRVATKPQVPWYDELWSSVQAADGQQ